MKSLTKEFCSHLEYRLSQILDETDREELKGFWCDGILSPPPAEFQNTTEEIRHLQKIKTIAWLGKTGQDEYEMTIWLGEKAFEKYFRDENLIECIPNATKRDWVEIMPENKVISVKLL